ncbi:MAG: hypothetical protein IJX92_08085 [Clostridia bacterium]|nr:hypothetical protein [Clostridia bacterium]
MNGKVSKLFKSLIAVSMTVCMAASAIAPVALGAGAQGAPSDLDTNGDGKINYLSLGEAAEIDGLDEYPELVRDALAANGADVSLNSLGLPGMRAEELHLLLDDYYEGDAYTAEVFAGMSDAEIDALREQYRSYIKNADVISVDVGTAGFSDYAISHVFEGKYDADYSDFDESIVYGIDEIKRRFFEVFSGYVADSDGEDVTGIVEDTLDAIFYSVVGYCVNLEDSIKHIYELNPDVQIVVMNVRNPLASLEAVVPGMNLNMPLGVFYGIVVDLANIYAGKLSAYSGDYYYAYLGSDGLAETYIDVIKDYNGDLTKVPGEVKAACDKAFGLDALAKASSLDYDDAYASLLDTALTVLKLGAANTLVDVGSAVEYAESKELLDGKIAGWLNAAASDASFAVENTADFKGVAADSAMMTVLTLGVRYDIAGGVLTEADSDGHKELADSVISAINNKTRGEWVVSEKMNPLYSAFLEYIDDKTVVDVEATLKPYYVKGKNSYYIALGDSSAKDRNKNSYVEKLASAIGFDSNHYANHAKDDMTVESAIQYVHDNYATIRKADLITVSFNNTDASRAMMDSVTSGGSNVDWEKYVGEDTAVVLEQAIVEIKNMLIESGLSESLATMALSAVESYAYAYLGRIVSYPILVDTIHKYSPNTLVVIIGTYNDLNGAVIEIDGSELAIGDYVQYLIDLANLETLFYSCINDNTAYVACQDVEIAQGSFTKTSIVNFALSYITALNKGGLKPSASGHENIKDAVMSTLTVVGPHPCTYDNACDTKCNICMARRSVPDHVYDNACDTDCNECGDTRGSVAHKYTADCDADCNACGAARTPASHTFGDWGEAKDGVVERACTACGITETKPADSVGGDNTALVVGISVGAVAVILGGGYGALTVVAKKKGLKTAFELFKK